MPSPIAPFARFNLEGLQRWTDVVDYSAALANHSWKLTVVSERPLTLPATPHGGFSLQAK